MQDRLISKEEAKIVADAGGVIGVWTHLADTPLEYAQNVRALVNVAGIDHVCIGTDSKMTLPYRPPATEQENKNKPQPDNKTDSSKVGDKKPGRIEKTTNTTWQNQEAGFFYSVVDAMLQTGFTEGEIEKFGGGNFCRIFDTATT